MSISEIDEYEVSIYPHLKELDKPSLNDLYQKINRVNKMRMGLNFATVILVGAALATITQPLTACGFGIAAIACKVTAIFFHKPPPYLILSIDGGGIRGMLPIQILSQIEEELGSKIGEVFDCIAGTSIGGILALSLAAPDPANPTKPKFSAQELAEFIEKQGPVVFEKTTLQSLKSLEGIRTPKYLNGNLKKLLEEQLGDTTIKEAVTDILVPSYDLVKGKTTPFFHFKEDKSSQPYLMRDVGVATAAAPIYFPSHPIQDLNLVDGALSANNPSLLAYMKAAGHIDPNRDIFILSMGTGEMKVKAINAFESKNYGMIQWIPLIFDVIFKTNEEMLSLQLKLLKHVAYVPLSVIRLQPTLESASQAELDNVTPANIQSLKRIAIQYFEENKARLRQELIDPLRKYRVRS